MRNFWPTSAALTLSQQSILLQLLAHFAAFMAATQEEICGELEVHKQQWPRQDRMVQLGESRTSSELGECLKWCCALPDCSAVSFVGFLDSSERGSANCSMFSCTGGECSFEEKPKAAAEFGILSVQIRRSEQQPPLADTSTTSLIFPLLTTPTAMSSSPADGNAGRVGEEQGEEEELNRTWPFGKSLRPKPTSGQISSREGMTTQLPAESANNSNLSRGEVSSSRSLLDLNSWDEKWPLSAHSTPVWTIGLAIVVTVVSIGLLITTLSSFLCYRRYRSRMRSSNITGPKKMPTLHAFNPS